MALDEADKKHIADAIAAALKPDALAAAVAPVVKAHVAEATKGAITEEALKAQFAEFAKTIKPADDDKGGKGGDKGNDKGNDKADPAVAALQKQLDDQKAQLQAAERARIDAERKAITDRNRNAVKAALGKAGLSADALDDALAIAEARGELVLDGDKPGWKGVDAYNLPTVHDFETGAKKFAGTDAGKRFLPASGAGGTGEGANNGRAQNGAGSIKSLDEVRGALAASLFGN
jgi:hypothetical protein